MPNWRSWTCVLLLAALASCQKKTQEPGGGAAYYKALNCRVCHKIAGQGGSGGPDLTFVGFRHSKAWLEAWLRDPRAWKSDALMPNPRLSDEARKAVADYLSTLRGQGYREGSAPWDQEGLSGAERGRVLFNRAGCSACHGKGGLGGFPNNNVAGGRIPALLDTSKGYTKEELARKIRAGSAPQKADPKGPQPLVSMPAWGQVLKESELDSLAEYLFSLKSEGPGSKDAW